MECLLDGFDHPTILVDSFVIYLPKVHLEQIELDFQGSKILMNSVQKRPVPLSLISGLNNIFFLLAGSCLRIQGIRFLLIFFVRLERVEDASRR